MIPKKILKEIEKTRKENKIKIVVERKGNVYEMPLTVSEVSDVYDILYMVDHEHVELNKMTKTYNSFFNKIEHLIHDVIYDGVTYDSKMVKCKQPYWVVKKPKWTKKESK